MGHNEKEGLGSNGTRGQRVARQVRKSIRGIKMRTRLRRRRRLKPQVSLDTNGDIEADENPDLD